MKALKVLLAAMLLIGAANMASAYDPLAGPVAISGEADLPFTPGPIIDNFSDTDPVNVWGGVTGTFSKYPTPPANSTCAASYTGTSLRLDYNVTGTDAYAGYYSKLGGQSASAYTWLIFWVRGTVGGELFKIELKNNVADNNRNHAAVYVNDFLDGGVTTTMQEVRIPFHNFANLNDFGSMKELVFVFERNQSEDSGSPLSGTVYIDQIAISSGAVNSVRIDHFGDKLGTCSLGGNMGDMSSGNPLDSASRSFTSGAGEYHDHPNALFSQYNVGWDRAGFFMLFGGGDTGWTAMPHDFSDYNYLTFYIKGWSGGYPNKVKIELADTDSVGLYWINVTDTWTKLSLPLASFGGLSKSGIKQFNVIYIRDAITIFGGSYNGGVYIDEVQFEK